MLEFLPQFEKIARRAKQFTEEKILSTNVQHSFDERNIHPKLPGKVKDLFDDGHYVQATFEAYKFLDKELQRLSELGESGYKLAMKALKDESPKIQLTPLSTTTEKDEQRGYQFIFAGAILAVRNPHGHEYDINETPDKCLDHLSLASMLLRRLEEAGYQ